MKSIVILLILLSLVTSGLVLGEECTAKDPPLVDVIREYSEATGTKFILDPRVRAKVNIVGRDKLHIDSATLIGILLIHGYSAFDSGGVVYVVPSVVGTELAEKLGEPWEG
ncbi:MAG: hypothetical protein KJO31_03095 [Gammaproteobacteria bacterium]|nr:hypothetical protein [Gammaproteobacteria bacterium]